MGLWGSRDWAPCALDQHGLRAEATERASDCAHTGPIPAGVLWSSASDCAVTLGLGSRRLLSLLSTKFEGVTETVKSCFLCVFRVFFA